jgi:hypothetical protein
MSKDLWFNEMVRIQSELEDEGYSESEAYRIAGDRAQDAVIDRLADRADYLRMVSKEGGQGGPKGSAAGASVPNPVGGAVSPAPAPGKPEGV